MPRETTMMRGLVLFVIWSLIEISLFVTLGAWIGLFGTLVIVIGSAVAGVAILRWQGAHVIATLKANVVALRAPLTPMAHSGLLALAAVLLILPGFLTDTLGLVLLLPPVRNWIVKIVGTRLKVAAFDRTAAMLHRRPSGDVVDATAVEVKSHQPSGPHQPSGWTKP